MAALCLYFGMADSYPILKDATIWLISLSVIFFPGIFMAYYVFLDE